MIDIGRTDNQKLAAVWLGDVLRDTRSTIANAKTQNEIDDLLSRIDDVLKQFDEIMGPEVRTYANELQLQNPFGIGSLQL